MYSKDYSDVLMEERHLLCQNLIQCTVEMVLAYRMGDKEGCKDQHTLSYYACTYHHNYTVYYNVYMMAILCNSTNSTLYFPWRVATNLILI